jgi:hypothetical protein
MRIGVPPEWSRLWMATVRTSWSSLASNASGKAGSILEFLVGLVPKKIILNMHDVGLISQTSLCTKQRINLVGLK